MAKKDMRIGLRVLYLGLLPEAIYGTIHAITQEKGAVEYWEVRTDQGMMVDAPADNFRLYEYGALYPGDWARYSVDEGGYWEARIIRPYLVQDEVCFLITVTNSETSIVKADRGYQFAARPAKLAKVS